MFKIRKTLIVTLLSIIFTNVGFAQSSESDVVAKE